MPVNAEPIWFFAGGDELFITKAGSLIRGTRVTANVEQIGARQGYVSHFATCPNADAHRREK